VHDEAIADHENCEKSEGSQFESTNANGDGAESVIATASITSCVSKETPQSTPQEQEIFLFGGFELIANVKTVEVYASKAPSPTEESYLTTCRGLPMRDIPPLSTSPLHIDGTTLDKGEITTTEDNDRNSKKVEDTDTFYKFIFVSPGGPKPVERIRLKFVRRNTTFADVDSIIIVRTLKVKGRLSDSMPPSKASQQSRPSPPMMMGTANINPGVLNNENNSNMSNLASMMAMMGGNSMNMKGTLKSGNKDNMNGLSSMMAMMGGNSMMGMPMPTTMEHQQLKMQSSQQDYVHNQQQHQQQQHLHQLEKNHAEMVSSIAGLGIFLKSSEERTMNRIETMLANMETRIRTRLDGLADRLDLIERRLNESSNDAGTNK